MLAIKSGESLGSQRRWRHTDDLAFLNPLIKGFEGMEPPPGDMDNWTGAGGDHSNTEPELPEVNCDNGCAGKPAEKPADIGEGRAHSRQRDISDGLVKSI